ncbi:restriction endonuclease subunit S [Anoxybacteroides rupiense]|uniref:restriction endonuclease subunit S n=1 Tax=Anoxybacteroides rupiense TaxID=311460 RepID=UPI0016057BFE|nr:restriction endonuclease subunit S [Anoxybacillus rupiensis]MBB3907316.1 type I restriction enzyme S subunit [Anoxybacillus rupiensis]
MSKTKQKSIDELLEEALVPEDEQPYQVPGNWVWVRLGSVISSVKGKKPKELLETRESKSIPYVTIDYLTNGVTEETKYVPEQISKVRCNKEDILMVWDGARSGFVGRGVEGEVGSTLAKLEKRNFDTGYLYYFLKSKYEYINNNHRGTGIPHVNPEILWNIPFPVSPLNEQKRIAEKIERLFAKIDEAKRLIEEVKESVELRRAAILEKAFRGELTKKWRQQNNVQQSAEEWLEEILNLKNTKTNKFNDQLDPAILDKLFELPEGWKWIRLNDLIESSVYGTSAKATDDSSGIPVLRMGNIVDGSIQFTDLKYLSNEHIDVQKLGLEVDDLLFNRTNSYELVGKTALVDESIAGQATFASYLIRVRLFYKDILAFYVCHYINSHIGRNMLLSMVTQQVGQANINSQKLASLPIPLPPREEIVEISKYLSYYREKEEQLKNILSIEAKIESLKHSILSKAFRGELGTNDPNDEHAIELLKGVLRFK